MQLDNQYGKIFQKAPFKIHNNTMALLTSTIIKLNSED